jgi:hypothetical protein
MDRDGRSVVDEVGRSKPSFGDGRGTGAFRRLTGKGVRDLVKGLGDGV